MTDFRSDTVTRPGEAMRQSMLEAPLGDDVFGDDPTVNALQNEAAELLGFEAALFVASGTQSNLLGIMSLCGRGDEVILGQMAHAYRWEGGGLAVLGSIQPQPIENEPDGSLSLDRIRAAIKPDDPHFARTRLLALENTFHGRVLPSPYLQQAKSLAQEVGLLMHLDGARLFNAAAELASAPTGDESVEGRQPASGTSNAKLPTRDAVVREARRICAGFDTVSLCLSKGLGCPVGSILLASRETIAQARRIRKMLGGGLRQAGILAAAGRFALANHLERLIEDHRLATRLSAGLEQLAHAHPLLGGRVRVRPATTNMVFVDIEPTLAGELASHLDASGLGFTSSRQTNGWLRQRWVTHLDLGTDDVEHALAIWRSFAGRD